MGKHSYLFLENNLVWLFPPKLWTPRVMVSWVYLVETFNCWAPWYHLHDRPRCHGLNCSGQATRGGWEKVLELTLVVLNLKRNNDNDTNNDNHNSNNNNNNDNDDKLQFLSLYWIHPVRLSVCLSVCPLTFSCPPCSIYSSEWILSIFDTNDQ